MYLFLPLSSYVKVAPVKLSFFGLETAPEGLFGSIRKYGKSLSLISEVISLGDFLSHLRENKNNNNNNKTRRRDL